MAADHDKDKTVAHSPGGKPRRRRVSRACDRCKSRKTRCSGKWPCAFCSDLGKQCNFTAIYRRGRLPSVELDSQNARSQPNAAPVGKCHSPAENQARIDQDVSISVSEDRDDGFKDSLPLLNDSAIPDETPPLNQTQNSNNNNNSANPPPTPSHRPPPPALSQSQSLRNTPEPLLEGPSSTQRDQQGHYVGPSSGVSFLLRIQRKLAAQSPQSTSTSTPSSSSIFTFGDSPFPEIHAQPFAILPPRSEAKSMVNRYFDFAIATHRYVHRPTIERWLEELYATNGAMYPGSPSQDDARSRIALLFMIFAHATCYLDGDDDNNPLSSSFPQQQQQQQQKEKQREEEEQKTRHTMMMTNRGARFFSAAEHQLQSETGPVRLTSIQARLAQCFYLLAQSRLNHCWTLFGTTVHLVFALGIHRRSFLSSSSGGAGAGATTTIVDWVDVELRKRTFWCTYNLSMYLSAALGRPMAFHEDDFDQEVPAKLDDGQLEELMVRVKTAAAATTTTGGKGGGGVGIGIGTGIGGIGMMVKQQSIMSAPVAHWRLSKIQASLLRDFYGIKRPPSSTDRLCQLASRYTLALDNWRKDIAYLLDPADSEDNHNDGDGGGVGSSGGGGSTSFFLQIVIRQRDVLRLAFYHARILVYRPFLLRSFASLNINGGGGRGEGGGGGDKGEVRRGERRAREKEMRENVQRCLDAALGMVRLVDRMTGRGKMYSTFFFIPYFAFSAAAVLYVHAIQQPHQQNKGSEDVLVYFKAARTCQKQLEGMATANSLPQRYGVVLEELQLEVRRHNKYLAAVLAREEEGEAIDEGELGGNKKTTTTTLHHQKMVNFAIDDDDDGGAGGRRDVDEMDISDGVEGGEGNFGGGCDASSSSYDNFLQILGAEGSDGNVGFPAAAGSSPEDPISQMTGWGQFDSLVTGGTGGLDAFFTSTGMDGWGVDGGLG